MEKQPARGKDNELYTRKSIKQVSNPTQIVYTYAFTICMQAACTFQGDIMKLFYLIIKAIILIFFVIIALINFHSVPFTYLPSQTVDLPLIVVMFGMFVVGALFGLFALLGRLLRLRHENARLRAEVQKSARLATQDIAAPVASDTTPATRP